MSLPKALSKKKRRRRASNYAALRGNPLFIPGEDEISGMLQRAAFLAEFILRDFQRRGKRRDNYFVDNEYYFKRTGIYGHFDDAEAFRLFFRAILQALPVLSFTPDSSMPTTGRRGWFRCTLRPGTRGKAPYKSIKSVFTSTTRIPGEIFRGDPGGCFRPFLRRIFKVEYDGFVNLMKGAIECADRVTTVSEAMPGRSRTRRFPSACPT